MKTLTKAKISRCFSFFKITKLIIRINILIKKSNIPHLKMCCDISINRTNKNSKTECQKMSSYLSPLN
jgi:hypothetical protein